MSRECIESSISFQILLLDIVHYILESHPLHYYHLWAILISSTSSYVYNHEKRKIQFSSNENYIFIWLENFIIKSNIKYLMLDVYLARVVCNTWQTINSMGEIQTISALTNIYSTIDNNKYFKV